MVWFLIFSHILGLLSSIHALVHARTSQGAIAWGISLITFPYLAVPAYWIFGRDKFQGYITSRMIKGEYRKKIISALEDTIAKYKVRDDGNKEAVLAAEYLARVPLLSGNKVELLIDGETTYKSILQAVSEAQQYILFQFYLIREDNTGELFKKVLIEKAKAGVKVYFLYDDVGCLKLSQSYFDELKTAGVFVSNFTARKGLLNPFQVNFRNHRKIVVVDGHSAWIGGINIGDEHLGKSKEYGKWRDTQIKITGPSVLSIQIVFIEDWYWVQGKVLDLNWSISDSMSDKGAHVLIIPTGPADELETATLMFVHAINSAKKRIWIASPYFVPDPSIIVALQLASLRGVDVRILTSGTTDLCLVKFAAFSYFSEVMKQELRFLNIVMVFHEKAMLIDSSVAAIGTANFDNRSFRLNFEITATVIDQKFVNQVEKMFVNDFSHSQIITDSELANKPWWFRVAMAISRLVSPIL